MADRIVVRSDGAIREVGSTGQILTAPTQPYTQSLIAAVRPTPRGARPETRTAAPQERPLLEVRRLGAGYGRVDAKGLPAARILDDVDLVIRRGKTVGVIGESGSGKTTLAKVIAGLVPVAGGSLLLDG